MRSPFMGCHQEGHPDVILTCQICVRNISTVATPDREKPKNKDKEEEEEEEEEGEEEEEEEEDAVPDRSRHRQFPGAPSQLNFVCLY